MTDKTTVTTTAARPPVQTSTPVTRQPPSPERVDAVEKAFAPLFERMGDGAPDAAPPAPAEGQPAAVETPGDPETPAVEKTREQVAAEKQNALLDERLAALRERTATQRARAGMTRQQQEIEQQRKRYDADVARLKELGITPEMSPAQIHEQLQARALAEKDPVLKNAMELQKLRGENEELRKRLDGFDQERQRETVTQARARAEQSIITLAKGDKYALLHEYLMNDQEIILSAHHAADTLRATRAQRGLDPEQFNEQDVVNEMLRTISERDTHFKQRRSQKPATAPGTEQPQAGAPPAQNGANPLNPALGDRRDSGQRPLSKKEREALVERQFEPFLKKRGYRSE